MNIVLSKNDVKCELFYISDVQITNLTLISIYVGKCNSALIINYKFRMTDNELAVL